MFRSVLYAICVSIFSTSFSLANTTTVDAGQKHLNEVWTRTGIDLEFVKRHALNDQKCAASWTNYLGCIQAAQVYMQVPFARNATVIVTDQWLNELKSIYAQLYSKTDVKIEADFGFYKIATITFVKTADSNTLASDVQQKQFLIKKILKENTTVWKDTFYKPGTPHLPLNELLLWIQKNRLNYQNEAFLSGLAYNKFLVDAVDAHASIIPEEIIEEREKNIGNGYMGLGVEMRMVADQVMVATVDDGSPAMLAGFRYKDVIVSIDGKNIEDMPLINVRDMMRGPMGSRIIVTVQRGGKLVPISLTRSMIAPQPVKSKILRSTTRDGQNHVMGYVSIADFNSGNICGGVRDAINKVQSQGIEALIIDVRNNPGGSLVKTACTLGLFLGPNQPVVEVHNNTNKVYSPRDIEYFVPTPPEVQRIVNRPVIVLQNAGSGSAAEIFAGTLQAAGVSVNIGVRSFGKGSSQDLFGPKDARSGRISEAGLEGIDDKSLQEMEIYKTQGYYYLVINQQWIYSPQVVGVSPDIERYVLPNPTEVDKIFSREEDVSPLSLGQVSQANKEPRPEVTAFYSSCMNQLGVAEDSYKAHQNDQLPPDYQLYSAEDVAACAVHLITQAGSARH